MNGNLFDDIAVGDTVITEEIPPQMYGHTNPSTGERDIIDAPMNPRAIQARKVAEWEAQEPTDEQLQTVCPHGNVLTIETCEECE